MKPYLICCVSVVAILAYCNARAQQGNTSATSRSDATANTAPANSDAVAEIVVTAQRRAERLQDVPIAITAATAEKIADAGITNAADLAIITPGLSMPTTSGTLQPHIRGVGTSSSGPGVENPIALYIDGVYIASGTSSMLTLNNIDRIEVLKGPQGTLFGRNATGGLIQVITKDPSYTTSGEANVTYANYNSIETDAYATGGLSDHTAADVAIRYEHQGDGWGHNFFNGQDVEKLDHDLSVRSRFVFDPGEDTKIKLAVDYADRKDSFNTQHGVAGYPLTFNNAFFGGPYNLGGNFDVNQNVDETSHLRTGGISLQFNQDFRSVALQSITAYRQSEFDFNLDLDLTPANLISCCGVVRAQQASQEFQLSSKDSGSFKWVSGLFFFYAKDGYQPLDIILSGPVSPVPGGAAFDINDFNDSTTRSAAAYGQGSYKFETGTTLTLGGRYTYEDRRLSGTESIIIGGFDTGGAPLPPAGSGIPSKIDFNKFNYRISLDQAFTRNILGYVSYNTGFKSGGYNLSSSSNPAYKPETINAAEVGVKTELFDQRLRFNIAGYFYKYSNLQVGEFQAGTEEIVNGAAAKIHGFDFDFEYIVGHGFALNGGAAYIHDRFTSYPDGDKFSGFNGCTAPPGSFCTGQNLAGRQLGQTPKWTYNVGPSYKTGLPNSSTLLLDVNYAYSAKWYATADNYAFQPSYELLNTSILWTSPQQSWSFRLWGKNLTNEVYATLLAEANQGVIRTLGSPRTYGVTVGYKF